MEHKEFFIEEMKAGDDAMTIEGYGSVFNNVDSGGDIILPGAFARSLRKLKPVMLWQHRTDLPIGTWDEMEETEKGLLMKGTIIDTALGLDAYKLIKGKAVKGLSIGYTTKKYEIDQAKGVRKLIDVDLHEVSPVTFPMNDKATITRVKNADGTLATEREIEEYLRDGGLSWREAKAFVAGGYKEIASRRDGEGQDLELVNLLKQFKV